MVREECRAGEHVACFDGVLDYEAFSQLLPLLWYIRL